MFLLGSLPFIAEPLHGLQKVPERPLTHSGSSAYNRSTSRSPQLPFDAPPLSHCQILRTLTSFAILKRLAIRA